MKETYGQQVRRLRREQGMTQAQLATASGVSYRTIQDVEGDKHEKPQRGTRLALNAVLGIAGDPDEERAAWPEDVRVILDIVGAYLMTITPEQRIRWVSRISATDVTGE